MRKVQISHELASFFNRIYYVLSLFFMGSTIQRANIRTNNVKVKSKLFYFSGTHYIQQEIQYNLYIYHISIFLNIEVT